MQAEPGHEMHKSLELRLKAEKNYLESQARAKLSRAANTRTVQSVSYLPGDLVYYQRYKTPADNAAHAEADLPPLHGTALAGRVLATETKISDAGGLRTPSSVVWIVAQGRLKKFHPSQLRHASETERDVAALNQTTTLGLINAGEYDDFTNPRQRSCGRDRGPSRSHDNFQMKYPDLPQYHRAHHGDFQVK